MTIIKMRPEQYSGSLEYVALLIEMMKGRGITAEQLLTNIAIPDQQHWNEPGARVQASDYGQIVRRAIELSGEPWLGWEFGYSMNTSSHGFLGYAAMSSNTLGDATELAVKFFHTRSTILTLSFFIEDGQAIIQAEEQVALNDVAPFFIESLFSSIYFMATKMLADQTLRGDLYFAYPQPDYFHRLKALLPGEAHFDCPRHQLRFDAKLLDTPLKFADSRLSNIARARCETEMATIEVPPALLGQVKRAILAEPDKFPSVDEVASDLHMSSRTLKRKLQQLDTSYQKVLDDLRRGLAVKYLTTGRQPIDEVAVLLGYSDASNFARAFRRWTGKNPSEYRK